ncbi:MAG: hypothetical protein PWP08_406 [Methanofollis sp.]|nr:hypothetical protein [Methanofollis sp.]
MDGRYPALAVAATGLASALSGVAGVAGIVAVAVFAAVFLLSRRHEGRWFSLLCAGSLVAVAAGLSSPLWSVAVMLFLLAGVEDDLGLLTSRRDGLAYALFAVAAALLLVPLAGLRHAALPLIILLVVGLAGAGALTVLWYRLVWTAQKGES